MKKALWKRPMFYVQLAIASLLGGLLAVWGLRPVQIVIASIVIALFGCAFHMAHRK